LQDFRDLPRVDRRLARFGAAGVAKDFRFGSQERNDIVWCPVRKPFDFESQNR
jgi:hypothetical protein